MQQYRLLIAEGRPALQALLRTTLQRVGYRTVGACTAEDAIALFETQRFHLLLVDWYLPEIGGWNLCEYIRRHSFVPLIVLFPHNQREEKWRAFEIGVDDFVVEPICPDEVLLRVGSLLRRSYRNEQKYFCAEIRRYGDLEIDFTAHCVRRHGQSVSLTPIEWAILKELVCNAGRVLTHEELLSRVWGESYGGEKEYLRVYIGRLRRKLGDDRKQPRYVITHHSIGYQFVG